MRRALILILHGVLLHSALPQQNDTDDIPLEQMNGRQIYAAFCSRCHGDDGRGDVPAELIENMEVAPPDLTEPYFSSREKRRDWYAVIARGGGARGLSMAMPAWDEALSVQQIHETVAYLKSFVDQSKYPQGELNFIRGHYTTKAFVEQEALLIPSHQFTKEGGRTVRETRVLLYYANRFGNRFQYEAKLPVHSITRTPSTAIGVGDLELGVKNAFYDNYETMTIVSAGAELSLPTGSRTRGFGAGTVVGVPFVAAGQGIGAHVQLSTSAKLELPFDRAKADPEFRASLLTVLTLPESKQGFFPGVELFYRKNMAVPEYTLSLVPQVYWGITARGHLAVSLGTEIPLAGTRPFDGRVVAFFLWDYVDGGLWW